jgi:hypothetical protein
MRVHKIVLAATLTAGFAFAAGSVGAKLLADKSAEQKQRKDIGKQGAKHALCMAKAAIKCEKNGVTNQGECDLTNPATSTVPDPDGKIKAKLAADLDKCTSKLAYAKKSATGNAVTDYTGIGCPGDSVMGGADDPFADLTAYQANVGPATRAQLELLQILIPGLCPMPADNQCGVDQADRALRYAKGLFKCIEKCENDYKDKKGNGGDNDDTTRCTVAGGDMNFDACTAKALDKAQKKGPLEAAIRVAVEGAISDASHDLYNEDDCP